MSAAYEWMDYSERMLRAEIAKIPDGEYGPRRGWLDDDARNRDVPLRVETKVIVEGDEITIDLTGSNAEVPTGYNVPFEGTLLVARLLRRSARCCSTRQRSPSRCRRTTASSGR